MKSPTAFSAEELQEFMSRSFGIKAKPKELERKAICVALLAHHDTLHLDTHLSLSQAMAGCGEQGWGFSYLQRSGDSMVARGRSFLASQFLTRPDIAHCTDLVFIDLDLIFNPEDFVRLCKHPVDVVGGAYPFKDESGNFPLQWSARGTREENGLWKMKAVTPGFFRITRKALERMAREMPWLVFADRGNKEGEKSYMFFDNRHRSTGIYDEGFIFCENWRICEGDVWLDPDLNITHIGFKKFNHGTIRGWLEHKGIDFIELSKQHPNVDPNLLMAKVMGQSVTLPVAA